jgi:hypothetical protein
MSCICSSRAEQQAQSRQSIRTCPTIFCAPTGHQPSRSKHHWHSASGHIAAPRKRCLQHYRAHSACNVTTCQYLVFDRSVHYSGSLSLHRCQRAEPQCSDGLGFPCAPSAHNASHGLMLPWHNWPMAVLLTHMGKLVTNPQQPVLQPGNHCASTVANTQSPRSGASVPQVGLINFSFTQYPYSPFLGHTYSLRTHRTNIWLSFTIDPLFEKEVLIPKW